MRPAETLAPLQPDETFGRELANWLFPAYLAVMLVGLMLIRWIGLPAGKSNGVRALFVAVNAGTLTGFSDNPGIGGLTDAGRRIVFMLIVAGSLLNMIIGGLAVKRIARLRFSDKQIVTGAFVVQAVALVLGASLLYSQQRSPFDAAFLSVSAFGNCGLCSGELPSDAELMVHAEVLPLVILGGLGLPVLMEMFDSVIFRKPLSSHSRAVLAMSAWLYVIAFVVLLALNLGSASDLSASDVGTAIRQSSILSVESRTGGMEIVSVRVLTEPARWIIVALMIIGASPAGTGSGLKTTTLAELFRGVRRLLAGQSVGRPLGIALSWLGIYLAMILGASILLSHVNPINSADHVLFNAVSGISNVGFSLSEMPDQKNLSFAYCAIMLLGRMAPLMVIWWMAESTTDADLAIG